MSILTDSIELELGVAEEWPDDVRLFQPYEVEQILLPDNANCLAVKAFLKICKLPFQVDHRKNAEFMSPNGQVPFIQCGKFLVSDLESIVQFVANKGISLTKHLSNESKLDMRAYMTLVNNVLAFSELYITWVDPHTVKEVTYPRNGYPYPWPLNAYQNSRKRNQIIRKLKVHGWYDKTLEDVLEGVDKCCSSLSEKLGDKQYFYGLQPTDLDALVFGHMFVLVTSEMLEPCPQVAPIIKKYPNLCYLCQRIESEYFKKS